MGIGADNRSTALVAFFARRLAKVYCWQHVYGFTWLCMLLPLIVMIVFAKEPTDTGQQTCGST